MHRSICINKIRQNNNLIEAISIYIYMYIDNQQLVIKEEIKKI